MGHHHGHDGFRHFSKARPVFTQPRLNGSAILYPPYGRTVDFLLDRILPSR